MILDPQRIPSPDEPSALAMHIAAEVRSACGFMLPDPLTVEELARAVDFFLRDQEGMDAVDSKSINLLVCQALLSLGEAQAARTLLLFGSGLVRPAAWEVSGDREMWILDLREMTVRADAALELMFFNGINIVLESISDIWDASAGSGVLGLRHVCSTATALLGGPDRSKTAVVLAGEIMDACSSKLKKIQKERGWLSAPEVMNLDL